MKRLWDHSERLVIALPFINTCPGNTKRFMENLQVCGDGHTVRKLISKLVP